MQFHKPQQPTTRASAPTNAEIFAKRSIVLNERERCKAIGMRGIQLGEAALAGKLMQSNLSASQAVGVLEAAHAGRGAIPNPVVMEAMTRVAGEALVKLRKRLQA